MPDHEPTSRRAEPTGSRPRLPNDYGVPATDDGLLSWRWAEERLSQARHYWIATTGPDGQPHAMPLWGVWLDGALYFGGHRRTRTGRNLAANPRLAVHIERDADIFVIEGVAEEITDVVLLGRLRAAGAAKYFGGTQGTAETGGEATGDDPNRGEAVGVHATYALQPRVAFGMGSNFPHDMTRWRFGTE